MKDLQAIARYMRLPDEQLRYPIELLNQGYEPIYLANYRPDELGSIDEQTLSILKRALSYSESLREHKERIEQTLQREQHWNETVSSVVAQANTISQVDTVTRHLRARRNSRSISEKCPQVEAVGQAILTMQGEPPADLNAWVAEVASVPVEQAAHVLEQTKRWLQYLLSEDVRLIHDLQKTILKTASISIKVLPDPPKGSDAEKQLEHAEANAGAAPVAADVAVAEAPVAETPVVEAPVVEAPVVEAVVADAPSANAVATEQAVAPESVSAEAASSNENAPESGTDAADANTAEAAAPAETTTAEVAPLIAGFHQGRKPGKALKTKTLSEKQLSPRQRRRKWLRGILESYAKLKKPLRALTPYQILMLSRGQRSQIVAIQFHYDERGLIQACRESLSPGRHPLHRLLLEIAEDGLRNHILPRLHQDVFSILEEDAHTDLTEAAVVHLQSSLLQRPVRGHRILLIDAVGPKMAAVAIVDSEGEVVFTNEIPCNSNRADIVAQNVVLLGEWIHTHRVSLVAISNGPSRRYLIHTISELMKQSTEGSLCWTIVDRAGADAYCMSRGCLVELPSISRRHRAAVWLARRLQDPLKQILKVDPVRLRLGSYQRELPQKELEVALKDAVSAAITKAGVDVFHADVEVLKRIPGMNAEAAKAIVAERKNDKITSRESLMAILKEHLSEMQARQAIGFLKVYGSSNTLDGTTIHPDDYRLADRLIENASLARPEAQPDNWTKPDYHLLEAANAAVESHPESAEIAKAQEFGAMIDTAEATDSAEAGEASETADAPADASEAVEASAESTENAPAETEASESVEGGEPSSETSASDSTAADETVDAAAVAAVVPELQNGPLARPALSIDVERLARSWQVGREKMKRVANCLQFPFADSRDFQYPVPLQNKVPRLDSLPPGTMLNALVIGVADFGVFVDLGPDCSGLIHISRLAPEFIEDPHQFVQVGDIVPVWVLNVDEKRKRVSLTAIPPGTPTRRHENTGEHSGQQNRGANTGDRPPRGNDSRPPRGGERGGDRGRRETPEGAGAAAHGGANRQGQGGGNRGAAGGNRSGGNRSSGKPPYGNRDRNRRDDRGNDSGENQTRRPPRIEPPKPVTPITDAMQQGKEPLRSFSDLLQFMKQSKDEPTQTKPNTDVVPTTDNTSASSSPQPESSKPDDSAPNVTDNTDSSSPA